MNRTKNLIENSELNESNIPLPNSDWDEIQRFALTFDGYKIDNIAYIANNRINNSLTDLRACLFFEQRRYRHMGLSPCDDDLEYIKSIISKIRLMTTKK